MAKARESFVDPGWRHGFVEYIPKKRFACFTHEQIFMYMGTNLLPPVLLDYLWNYGFDVYTMELEYD